jgi:hypothetical protein
MTSASDRRYRRLWDTVSANNAPRLHRMLVRGLPDQDTLDRMLADACTRRQPYLLDVLLTHGAQLTRYTIGHDQSHSAAAQGDIHTIRLLEKHGRMTALAPLDQNGLPPIAHLAKFIWALGVDRHHPKLPAGAQALMDHWARPLRWLTEVAHRTLRLLVEVSRTDIAALDERCWTWLKGTGLHAQKLSASDTLFDELFEPTDASSKEPSIIRVKSWLDALGSVGGPWPEVAEAKLAASGLRGLLSWLKTSFDDAAAPCRRALLKEQLTEHLLPSTAPSSLRSRL